MTDTRDKLHRITNVYRKKEVIGFRDVIDVLLEPEEVPLTDILDTIA